MGEGPLGSECRTKRIAGREHEARGALLCNRPQVEAGHLSMEAHCFIAFGFRPLGNRWCVINFVPPIPGGGTKRVALVVFCPSSIPSVLLPPRSNASPPPQNSFSRAHSAFLRCAFLFLLCWSFSWLWPAFPLATPRSSLLSLFPPPYVMVGLRGTCVLACLVAM